ADFNQVTARRVRDRQRIAAHPIKRAKPALEIDRPFVVGGCGGRHSLTLNDPTAATAAFLDPAGAPEDIADRRGRRPVDVRHMAFQPFLDLLGTKERELASCRHYLLDQPIRNRVRTMLDRVAQLLEPMVIATFTAVLPDVECFPTDTVPSAKIRN